MQNLKACSSAGLVALLLSSVAFSAPLDNSTPDDQSNSVTESHLAQAGKGRRGKKRRAGRGGAGAAPAAAASDHGPQETPGPYSAIISLGAAFSSTSSTAEVTLPDELQGLAADEPTATESSSTRLALSGTYAMIFDAFAVGPSLEFSNESSEGSEDSKSSFSIGGVAQYHFGDVQKDASVPFVAANVKYISSDPMSGFAFGGAAGMLFFLDSNIALGPAAVFEYESLSTEVASVSTTRFGAKIEIVTFR